MTVRASGPWSCPMLAAVWQLIRLGLLRGAGPAGSSCPKDWGGAWPDSWDEMPAITRLTQGAAAFSAYTTISALSPRFPAGRAGGPHHSQPVRQRGRGASRGPGPGGQGRHGVADGTGRPEFAMCFAAPGRDRPSLSSLRDEAVRVGGVPTRPGNRFSRSRTRSGMGREQRPHDRWSGAARR